MIDLLHDPPVLIAFAALFGVAMVASLYCWLLILRELRWRHVQREMRRPVPERPIDRLLQQRMQRRPVNTGMFDQGQR